MNKKRLFIGTFVDKSLFEYVYPNIKADFQNVCKGKWVDIDNLHFTYIFIGEVAEDKVSEIIDCIGEYLGEYDTELYLKGLGVFPNQRRPRVLFANILNEGNQVFDIQSGVENSLKEMGFKPEKRKYIPHLTLCRIKFNQKDFAEVLNRYKQEEFGAMESFKVNLIESKLTRQGPIYAAIK